MMLDSLDPADAAPDTIACSRPAAFDFRDLFDKGEKAFAPGPLSYDSPDDSSVLLFRAYPDDLSSEAAFFLASFDLSLAIWIFFSFCTTLLLRPLKAFDS